MGRTAAALDVEGVADGGPPACGAGEAPQLGRETALPHPCGALDQQHPAPPGRSRVPRCPAARELGLAPDHPGRRRRRTHRGGGATRSRGARLRRARADLVGQQARLRRRYDAELGRERIAAAPERGQGAAAVARGREPPHQGPVTRLAQTVARERLPRVGEGARQVSRGLGRVGQGAERVDHPVTVAILGVEHPLVGDVREQGLGAEQHRPLQRGLVPRARTTARPPARPRRPRPPGRCPRRAGPPRAARRRPRPRVPSGSPRAHS